MTRAVLAALIITIYFKGLISEDVSILSVWQTPENITWKGTDESITCHIRAELGVKRIVIKWMQGNQTNSSTPVKTETINLNSRSNVSGSIYNYTTLNLLSERLNSGTYYCTAQVDVPSLETIKYGNGTYVYVVTTTPPPPTTTAGPPTPDNKHIVKWSLLSGLAFVSLIAIACVSRIYHKGYCRKEPRASEVLVDASDGSPSHDAYEAVVYAAIKIQDSVKSTQETSAPLAVTSETCSQDSVTYSEVHIKKRPKDEG